MSDPADAATADREGLTVVKANVCFLSDMSGMIHIANSFAISSWL